MNPESSADALPTPADAPSAAVHDPVARASAAAATTPTGTPVPAPSVAKPLPGWLVPLMVAMGAATLFAVGASWQVQRQNRALEQELVRRQQDSTLQVTEAKALAKSAQEVARDASAKVALLDTRLGEVALQRTQLEELMQSLSRSRDENLVTDIDAAIRVSLQQMAITGSAEPLVAALRTAEERLARVSATQPRLDSVRRAIARDLDRVRAVGVADMGALLIKLDECIRLIDELPLVSASAAKPAASSAQRTPAPAPVAASAAPAGLGGFGRWLRESAGVIDMVWAEVRGLVRVTRIDQPESMLVAPDQSFLLRENLKLRLLNARLSLLSRQAESAQGDLQNAMSAVTRYFDGSSKRTQIALELMKQVATQTRQSSLPRPDETLAALTAAAAGR